MSSVKNILIIILIISVNIIDAKPKLELISPISCDRYSLDALYYEKYQFLTEDILTDSTIFIKKLIENIDESLQDLIVQIPGHDKTNKEDVFMHNALTSMKDLFERNTRKLNKNITSHWESFIETNHKFLAYDNNVTFKNVIKCVENLDNTYKYAKIQLDKHMEVIISFVKSLMKDSFTGIEQIVNLADHHDHANETSQEEKQDKTEKKKSIIKDILPPFMSKLTEKLIDRKINLSEPVSKTIEERDSVLDDLSFSLTVMLSKVKSIEYTEFSSEDYIDLMRRNLYLLWAETMNSVYKDRIAEGYSHKKNSIEKFQEFWSNEDELVNTLINLLEVYP